MNDKCSILGQTGQKSLTRTDLYVTFAHEILNSDLYHIIVYIHNGECYPKMTFCCPPERVQYRTKAYDKLDINKKLTLNTFRQLSSNRYFEFVIAFSKAGSKE